MERLTKKKDADIQRKKYENRLKNGCFRNIHKERFLKLAAYEDTDLEPHEITVDTPTCVFYCNRKCNIYGDWCIEGPGCPYNFSPNDAMRLLKIAQDNKLLNEEKQND